LAKHETLFWKRSEAIRFLLEHQGLTGEPVFYGKEGIASYVRRVGCIQYDALDQVGKNADLVLQARIPGYRPTLLADCLYADRSLLDGIDKVMSIYPVEDWPFFARRRQEAREWHMHEHRGVAPLVAAVRSEIEAKGPICSGDLDMNHILDWSWGPTRAARAALESMYLWGELVIHHKAHTRKYYDLAERHIGRDLLDARDPHPSREEFEMACVERRIGGVGLLWTRSGDAWTGLFDIRKEARENAAGRLLEAGRIRKIDVEGVDVPLYARTIDLERFVSSGEIPFREKAFFMAPLDNLLWERKLLTRLFGFDYRWEVYKPAVTRQYGYYVLPVLYGGRFIARFEPIRNRKAGTLTIGGWWWEPGVEPDAVMKEAIRECMKEFMAYLGLQQLVCAEDMGFMRQEIPLTGMI
jgi:uncharacterized protein